MKQWTKYFIPVVAALTAACGGSKDGTVGPDTTKPQPKPGEAAFLVAAGNIAKCGNSNADATARLIDTMTTATVIAVGNAANPGGRPQDYSTCYEPTWGRFKARTYAALGNHDYDSLPDASGAFGYFGDRAGPVGLGYYSFDIGSWHVIVLNAEPGASFYDSGSQQQAWLAGDLTANAGKKCTVAVLSRTRFFSSSSGGNERTTLKSLWSRLAAGGVDVVISGRQYFYERMRPVNPDGADDPNGIVQFNVGLGGESVAAGMPSQVSPISATIGLDMGVLRMALRADGYDFNYIPITAGGFTDAGSGTCH